jgi:probable phosphoglycerate mutase
MKTVYLVRHGESEVNVSTHFLSEESPLTAQGREQAGRIAARASSLKLDAVVSSTMGRAIETAAIIARETGHTVEESDLFVERRIPDAFYGLEKKAQDTMILHQEWLKGFFTLKDNASGGDDFTSLFSRAREALAFLQKRGEERLMVVTHGFFIRMLIAEVIFGDALTPEMFRSLARATSTEHTGITLLRYGKPSFYQVDPEEARWEMRIYNDHAHLG